MSSETSKKTDKSRGKESQTYQSMLEDVEGIVRTVSSGSMDLDEIVTKVEQGYKLITQMRERLDSTKAKVERLRTDFESQKTETASAPKQKMPAKAEENSEEEDDAPF